MKQLAEKARRAFKLLNIARNSAAYGSWPTMLHATTIINRVLGAPLIVCQDAFMTNKAMKKVSQFWSARASSFPLCIDIFSATHC